jgi:hypothetical protein
VSRADSGREFAVLWNQRSEEKLVNQKWILLVERNSSFLVVLYALNTGKT